MSRLDFCKYELVDDCYDWKNDHCDGCNIFKAYCEGARRAKNSIVRCKDCKYCWYDDYTESLECRHNKGLNEEIYGNDFCCYGERKK